MVRMCGKTIRQSRGVPDLQLSDRAQRPQSDNRAAHSAIRIGISQCPMSLSLECMGANPARYGSRLQVQPARKLRLSEEPQRQTARSVRRQQLFFHEAKAYQCPADGIDR